jgi:hypothetical protein
MLFHIDEITFRDGYKARSSMSLTIACLLDSSGLGSFLTNGAKHYLLLVNISELKKSS